MWYWGREARLWRLRRKIARREDRLLRKVFGQRLGRRRCFMGVDLGDGSDLSAKGGEISARSREG